ncbi:MAG: amidase [Planctomycetes bacterium]|nr:amidase [Planctomycetota bacterium]
MSRTPALPILIVLAALAAAGPAAEADARKPRVNDKVWSPNYTASRSRRIRYVVIHTVQGSYAGAMSWFKNRSSRVSAHYVVSFKGRLGQCVKDKNIAWHAGNWSYNVASIGIEHEGYVSRRNNYTTPMLRKSAALTRFLCDKYRIPIDRRHIISHKQVPGSTHTDPGPYFPWRRYIRMVKQAGGPRTRPVSTRAVVFKGFGWVRKKPAQGGAKLGKAPKGQRFVRTHRRGNWLRVWYDGRAGWIREKSVRTLSRVPLVLVRAKHQPRLAPEPGAERWKRFLAKGQLYARDARENAPGWFRIWLGPRQAWVKRDKVRTLVR